jgi:hypothetical protein
MSNVLKASKKVLTTGVVFSTMLWSVGVSALLPVAAAAASCPTFKSGDMLKVTGKPAIYAVDSNGKVLYFPTGDEFKSWTSDNKYGGYTTVSQECYDSLPVPSMAPYGVTFRPGTYVVKRASSDQLYVVQPGNKLAKITVEAARALYGSSYKVMTVADVFWPNYSSVRGADVTEAKVHPGMLVSNGGKKWYVNSDSKLQEVTDAGFSANRFQSAFTRVASDAMIAGLSFGEVISGAVSTLSDRTQTGGGSSVIPGATGGNLTVSLAGNNPAGMVLASGSAFNQVLKLNLSAGANDVSVTGLTLRKGGFVANTAVSGVDVIDSAGVRHGNVASSISTDNDVTLLFAGAPIVVKAGATETVTIRVNLGSTATSGTISFSVASASAVASNGTVGGSFPVSGNTFSLESGSSSIGTATLNIAAINASGATLNVDANNQQEIAKFNLAVGSNENVKLGKLVLYNNGTASDSDVADVQLVAQNGDVLATAQQVSKTVTFDLSANPHLIEKGQTKSVTVRAKIVNGAARTIQFVVYNDYDAVLTGVNTGTSLLPSTTTGGTSGSGTSFPVGNKTSYNLATIGSGTISFNKDTSSPSSAVAPNTNNAVLAKFFAKPNGESMELRKIGLGFVTGTVGMFSGSFTVKVNGSSVYSGTATDIANTSTSATLTSITLSTYPTLTVGVNNYITVEANINSQATNGSTSTVSLDLTEVKRLVTNDITDPSVSVSTANQITVQAAALKVSNLSTPVAQSVVVGTSGVTLATIELSPSVVSSGEDARVSRIVISDTVAGGAAVGDISNLNLYDSNGNLVTTSASTATNAASNTFTFSNPLNISKTGSIVLTLKGDVIANAGSGTHTFAVKDAGNHVTATGKDTGNSVTPTGSTAAGQALTVANSGTLTLSLVSGTNAAPSNDQVVSVGATNLPVFAFRLTAQKEAIKLTSLTLMATGTINSLNDLVNIKLYRDNETSPFASANQMSSYSNSGQTTSTFFTWTATDNLLSAPVQPGTSVTIYVKADIGAAGQAYLGDSFHFGILTTSHVVAKGSASGQTATVSGVPNVTTLTYIAPFSVLATADAPTAGSSVTQAVLAGTQLARIKLTNNGSAKVTINGIKFTDSGSHTGTTTTYKLLYSDQNSSNYTQNTASSTMGSVDFTNLSSQGTTFTIDGGAYRFVTVAINTLGSSVAGDSYQLSIASIGDIRFVAAESDLGYDSNNSGSLSGNSGTLYGDGKPTMGTLVKQ